MTKFEELIGIYRDWGFALTASDLSKMDDAINGYDWEFDQTEQPIREILEILLKSFDPERVVVR